MSRVMLGLVGLGFVFAVPAPAEAQMLYYWKQGAFNNVNGIVRQDVQTGTVEELIPVNAVTSVTVDAAGGKIYYIKTGGEGSNIWQANMDGSDAHILFPDVSGAYLSIVQNAAGAPAVSGIGLASMLTMAVAAGFFVFRRGRESC